MQNSNFKILLVDDETMIDEMYKIKFLKEGFEVEVATDGLEAYASVIDFQPDIVLLDIMMPHMDGLETLKLFRQDPSFNAKVIILSNINSTQYITKAKELGAHDYLVKSNCTPSFVVEKVKSLI